MPSNINPNCPCPKECPRHGDCRACVAHHLEAAKSKEKTTAKLPACLRGIDWAK